MDKRSTIVVCSVVVVVCGALSAWYLFSGGKPEVKKNPWRIAFDAVPARAEGAVVVQAVRNANKLIEMSAAATYTEVPTFLADLDRLTSSVATADVPGCLHLARVKAENALRNAQPIVQAFAGRPPSYLSETEVREARLRMAERFRYSYTTGLDSLKAELESACGK